MLSNGQKSFVTRNNLVTGLTMGHADGILFADFVTNYQLKIYLKDDNDEYQYSDTYSSIRTWDFGEAVGIPTINGYVWESVEYFDEEGKQVYLELPEYYSTDPNVMPSVVIKYKKVN